MAASIRSGIYRRQAVLDGAEGARRAVDRRDELKAELDAEVLRLQRHLRSQNAGFGPLVCLPRGSGKARYHDEKTWYSFGFRQERVNSTKALARRVGLLGHYFLLYSPLSDLGHARETDFDLTVENGRAGIYSPHDPRYFPVAAYWAASWHRLALAHATKAYCPQAHTDIQDTDQRIGNVLSELGDESTELVL
jgi:hypothetical protein